MRRGRAGKTAHVGMDVYDVEVTAAHQLSPHVRRLTFGARELHHFEDDGPDQRFKLLLPRDGQTRPHLPGATRWYEDWLAMPHEVRPIMRTYTIRAARPAAGEVDVDMVTHEDAGPGSAFALTARPGVRAGIQGAYAEYEPPAGTSAQIFAGDLSALPALAAMSERSDPRHLLITLDDPADAAAFDAPGADTVQWVQEDPDRPGWALEEALRALPPVPADAYAWLAGEQDMVARLRRHVVRDRGLHPSNVMFMGYWRRGGSIEST